ncbi:putative ABC transporter permease [Anaerococcus provencensis]|uniref:putative ABC transporter permease n=1 Tax=Anaerococcus provencensis TaxID=938293 RepID=UPI0002EE81C0|nr:putative ABC transporter permease [Anaerococcus provencensis]
MTKVYIIYFFIYAIVGWILEVSYNGIRAGKYINCGVLNGPWCPIYGFAAVSIILLLNKVETDSKIFLLLASIVIASIIELITGFILEKIFHKKWWDYSDKKFNIGGHICAEYSLLWGALCFILYEAIHPMIRSMVFAMPYKLTLTINIIVAILFAIDTTASFNTIIGINKKFKQIERSSEKLGELTSEIGEKIADRGIETAELTSEKRKEFDQRSAEFKAIFEKKSERRILKAFPNLIRDLEDKGYDISEIKEKIKER